MTATVQPTNQYSLIQFTKQINKLQYPVVAKPGKKRSRSVNFNPTVSIRKIKNTYTLDEIQATWYSQYEFDQMKREILETVELMERNSYIDDIQFCKRGVEPFTTEGAEFRRSIKLDALYAVLEMQNCVRSQHNDRTKDIAFAYSQATSACQKLAYRAALADEKFASSTLDFKFKSSAARLIRGLLSMAA